MMVYDTACAIIIKLNDSKPGETLTMQRETPVWSKTDEIGIRMPL